MAGSTTMVSQGATGPQMEPYGPTESSKRAWVDVRNRSGEMVSTTAGPPRSRQALRPSKTDSGALNMLPAFVPPQGIGLTDRISAAAALPPGGADGSSVNIAPAAPTGEISARLSAANAG
jgi:hypothetical protein